jgi:hypothetical protein
MMRVVVLGHPRSGTGYTAACFRRAGWDVGHEKIGQHGISSWMWAVDSDEVPWGEPRFGTPLPGIRLHIHREPAAAVSSVAFTERSTEAWRSRYVPLPFDAGPIERAVWSLHGWAMLVRESGPTHIAQIEQVEESVEEITGVPLAASTDDRNTRQHGTLSADQLNGRGWKHAGTESLWEGLVEMHTKAAR